MVGFERASRFEKHSVGAGGHFQNLAESNGAYQHDPRCSASELDDSSIAHHTSNMFY